MAGKYDGPLQAEASLIVRSVNDTLSDSAKDERIRDNLAEWRALRFPELASEVMRNCPSPLHSKPARLKRQIASRQVRWSGVDFSGAVEMFSITRKNQHLRHRDRCDLTASYHLMPTGAPILAESACAAEPPFCAISSRPLLPNRASSDLLGRSA